MWSDPVLPADEGQLDARGFAPNAYRGQGCVFGSAALDEMRRRFGITHLLRAHQAKSVGITLAKQARVLTVRSPPLSVCSLQLPRPVFVYTCASLCASQYRTDIQHVGRPRPAQRALRLRAGLRRRDTAVDRSPRHGERGAGGADFAAQTSLSGASTPPTPWCVGEGLAQLVPSVEVRCLRLASLASSFLVGGLMTLGCSSVMPLSTTMGTGSGSGSGSSRLANSTK